MRIVTLSLVAAATLVFAGCSGPEKKLGRGISNMTALAGGDISRSVEQTTLWDGPNTGSTGFISGLATSTSEGVSDGISTAATFEQGRRD